MLNSYSGPFCENSERLNGWTTFTTSARKTFIKGVWQGPKYTCEDFFFKTRKDTTTNENNRCLLILILNFNFTLYHLHLTVWTLHPTRLFFFRRNVLEQSVKDVLSDVKTHHKFN